MVDQRSLNVKGDPLDDDGTTLLPQGGSIAEPFLSPYW
jgi:hypothetical protein